MILLCYGTRPEWIKIQPLIDALNEHNVPNIVLFTGQHKDIGGGKWDRTLSITDGYNRLDSIVSSVLNYDPEYVFDGISHVLVQGDTTTGMALALSAFHKKIPVIHLEAGLRTWDKENPYPEETNRCIISSIADIHLCPTQTNYDNLIACKVEGEKYIVGNTVLDTIDTTPFMGTRNKVLITMHRRENHDDIDKYFTAIEELANEYTNLEFVIPLHPNPNVQKHRDIFKRVSVINPLNREELIQCIKESIIVISDSGGIQEECSYLKRNLIVCRKVTERPESVGEHSFLCEYPGKLKSIFYTLIDAPESKAECPYGDGNSSTRITVILKNIIR